MIFDIGDKRQKGTTDEFMTKTGSLSRQGYNW